MAGVEPLQRFLNGIRRGLADDGALSPEEVAAPLHTLGSSKISDDIKAEIASDLFYRAGRPRRMGGVPITSGRVRIMLGSFVERRDHGVPGLWLDPPTVSKDPATRFVNSVRPYTASGRTLTGRALAGPLGALERAPIPTEVKAHLVESLLLASNADRRSDGFPIDTRAERMLKSFLERHDPQRNGLDWFKPPRP